MLIAAPLQISPKAIPVLVVDGAPAARMTTVYPIEAAGCACTAVRSVPEALQAIGARRPQLVFLSAATVAAEADADLQKLRRTLDQAPVVMLAEEETATEVIERGWAAGADDCILGTLRLAQVQERVAAVAATIPAAPARKPQAVVVIGEQAGSLAHVLELEGFSVARAADGADAVQLTRERPPDVVVIAAATDADRGLDALRTLRGRPQTRATPVIFACRRPPPAVVDAGVIWVDAEHPVELVVRHANALSHHASMLRSHERTPFFCPVEVRETGADRRWSSGYSFDLSPGGIFIRTLLPIRRGAAVELRIHLTMTRELIEGTGVVSWANPYARRTAYSYPIGMGVQFLGMSPKRLGQLRELCRGADPH